MTIITRHEQTLILNRARRILNRLRLRQAAELNSRHNLRYAEKAHARAAELDILVQDIETLSLQLTLARQALAHSDRP